MDRDIAKLSQQDKVYCNEVKQLAKKNQTQAARILAKEIAQTRKTIQRLHVSKSQMESLVQQVQQQLSTIKVQGCLQQSSNILKLMNQLVSMPEMRGTIGDMAKEMEKAGLIQGFVDDALDDALSCDAVDDEAANEEVDKIMSEITASILAPVDKKVPTKSIQSSRVIETTDTGVAAVEEEADEGDDEELKAIKARIAAL